MNEMLQTIMERRSTRKYNDKPVTEEQLADILEAGRYAPTGGNCQTVHFVVIMNEKIRENLRGLVQEAFLQMELSDDQWKAPADKQKVFPAEAKAKRQNSGLDVRRDQKILRKNRKISDGASR